MYCGVTSMQPSSWRSRRTVSHGDSLRSSARASARPQGAHAPATGNDCPRQRRQRRVLEIQSRVDGDDEIDKGEILGQLEQRTFGGCDSKTAPVESLVRRDRAAPDVDTPTIEMWRRCIAAGDQGDPD